MVLFHCCQFVRISPLQSGGKAGDAPDQSQIQNDQGDRPEHIPIGKGDEIPKQLEQGISLGGQREHIIDPGDLAEIVDDPVCLHVSVQCQIGKVYQSIDSHGERHGDRGRAEIEADQPCGEEEHRDGDLQGMGDIEEEKGRGGDQKLRLPRIDDHGQGRPQAPKQRKGAEDPVLAQNRGGKEQGVNGAHMEGEIFQGESPHKQIEQDRGDAGEGEHEQDSGLYFRGACPQKKMESHDHGDTEE